MGPAGPALFCYRMAERPEHEESTPGTADLSEPRLITEPGLAARVAAIAEPVPVVGETVAVTASIGVVPARADAPIAELLHNADQAMYEAKTSGSAYVVADADAATRTPFMRPDRPAAHRAFRSA